MYEHLPGHFNTARASSSLGGGCLWGFGPHPGRHPGGVTVTVSKQQKKTHTWLKRTKPLKFKSKQDPARWRHIWEPAWKQHRQVASVSGQQGAPARPGRAETHPGANEPSKSCQPALPAPGPQPTPTPLSRAEPCGSRARPRAAPTCCLPGAPPCPDAPRPRPSSSLSGRGRGVAPGDQPRLPHLDDERPQGLCLQELNFSRKSRNFHFIRKEAPLATQQSHSDEDLQSRW